MVRSFRWRKILVVWNRFWSLPVSERRLLVSAAVVVVVCRLGLWVLPFPWVRRLVERAPAGRTARLRQPDRISWAVQSVSQRIPRATCLVQALAVRLLLAWEGHPSRLHIGVALNGDRKFEAHAWIEAGGRILIGGADAEDRYSRFAVWEGKRVRIDGSHN